MNLTRAAQVRSRHVNACVTEDYYRALADPGVQEPITSGRCQRRPLKIVLADRRSMETEIPQYLPLA